MPVEEFEWGSESVLQVKFNPSEGDLLAATGLIVFKLFVLGIDRSIVLYDLRGSTPLKKIFLANKA